jgi:intergrase/recombinase
LQAATCKNEPWPGFGPGTFALPRHEVTAANHALFDYAQNLIKYPKILPIIPSDELWSKFESHLKHNMNSHSLKCSLTYAKKYLYILNNQDAQDLLLLSPDKRNHVMKALANLSKFMGCYDIWRNLIERYELKWSSNDSFQIFSQITNSQPGLNSMMYWLKETCSKIPVSYAKILLFSTLVGLRPQESISSIRLIKENLNDYLQDNANELILQHYKFPAIFFRRTKKAYTSVIIRPVLDIAHESGNHGYNALRLMINRNGLNMNMSYCRKIFATHLRNDGIQPEVVDLLQGRMPQSIFVKHYFRPNFPIEKIQNSISILYNSLLNL